MKDLRAQEQQGCKGPRAQKTLRAEGYPFLGIALGFATSAKNVKKSKGQGRKGTLFFLVGALMRNLLSIAIPLPTLRTSIFLEENSEMERDTKK